MVDAIRDFRRRLQGAVAERAVPTAHGIGYFADSISSVYDANYLSVEEVRTDAATLAAEADAVMEAFHHRRLIVEQPVPGLADDFADLGFMRATHLVLAHRRPPDKRVDTSTVREVPLESLLPSRTQATLSEPWGDEEIARQLNDFKRLVATAVDTRFFAALVDGEVAAYCELRSAGRVAQIEDVEAVSAYRGRGLGRAIVQHALDEALGTHQVVFLEALADDWPRELYAKLGFGVVDRREVYTRLPHPLTRLRLRTPRLELRLATVAELRSLYRVAAAGIHDPEEMPFGVAWTDDLEAESFLAFHLGKVRAWDPEDWGLVLVAFEDGRPVGVQDISGERFAERRVVTTGSWLGRGHQGRGLGTEMRTAVLALAFRGLGARVARSGAIKRNPQSLGVSRKLGYAEVGSHVVSPRGEPLEHVDLELRAGDFDPPVPVAIEGLESLLPLFGLLP